MNPECKKRLLSTDLTAESLVGLYSMLGDEIGNLPSATVVVLFYDDDSGLKPGDLAAELHLVIRRVADETEVLQDESGNDQDNEGDV